MPGDSDRSVRTDWQMNLSLSAPVTMHKTVERS